MNNKTLAIIAAIALIIALVTTVMYQRTKRELESIQAWKDQDPFIQAEIEMLKAERIEIRKRAEQNEARADSLQSVISKVKKQSNQTTIEYVEDLNAWRALPPSDRDVRINFFSKELSTVDSIPIW
jgi:peptidoglycan hydrolase CwlO-like protein